MTVRATGSMIRRLTVPQEPSEQVASVPIVSLAVSAIAACGPFRLASSLMAGKRIRVRRSRVMETAYLDNLHAESLQPGQQPVQGGLIL